MKPRSKKILIIASVVLIILVAIGLFLNHRYVNKSYSLEELPRRAPTPLYDDFRLIIPSIDVQAPVIEDVEGSDENEYFSKIENGVAQYRGTSKPGQGSNTFIFGHSSFYWYKPGNYKTVFEKLPEVKVGDEIMIWYQSKEYRYRVEKNITAEANETDYIKPTTEEIVTLMTCVPIGTDQKRQIVIAKRVQ